MIEKDIKLKVCKADWKQVKVDTRTGDLFFPYMVNVHTGNQIKSFDIPQPDKELIKLYEEKKRIYLKHRRKTNIERLEYSNFGEQDTEKENELIEKIVNDLERYSSQKGGVSGDKIQTLEKISQTDARRIKILVEEELRKNPRPEPLNSENPV